MNSFTFNGRIARDAEVKEKFTVYTVANTAGYGDRKVTHFVRCVQFGQAAANLAEYLRKGKQVVVTGELKATIHDTETKSHLNMDVVVNNIELIKDYDAKKNNNYNNAQPQQRQQTQQTAFYSDDDIPF